MGFFDWFTGTRKPAEGVPPKPASELRAAILALNRPTAPFAIRDGGPEKVDLVAEWRIVDATWHEIFAKAGLTRVFKVLMKLDPDPHEVRAVDQEWSVEWRAGVPTIKVSATAFRGQKTEVSFGTAYVFTETAAAGQVYRYKFATSEIKHPLQEAVTKAGWTWKGVAFGRL
jgi:hypothetical protein